MWHVWYRKTSRHQEVCHSPISDGAWFVSACAAVVGAAVSAAVVPAAVDSAADSDGAAADSVDGVSVAATVPEVFLLIVAAFPL